MSYGTFGGIDGCWPRYLFRDREANLLFFFNPKIVRTPRLLLGVSVTKDGVLDFTPLPEIATR
jgi:hypothetical protein